MKNLQRIKQQKLEQITLYKQMYLRQDVYGEDVQRRNGEEEQQKEQELQQRMGRQWCGFESEGVDDMGQAGLLMIQKQLYQDIEQQYYDELHIGIQNGQSFSIGTKTQCDQQQQQSQTHLQQQQSANINRDKTQSQSLNKEQLGRRTLVERFMSQSKMNESARDNLRFGVIEWVVYRLVFIVLIRMGLLQLMDRLVYGRLWRRVCVSMSYSLTNIQQPMMIRIFYLLLARVIQKLKHSQRNNNSTSNKYQSQFATNRWLFDVLVMSAIVGCIKWTIIDLVSYLLMSKLVVGIVDNSYLLCILSCVITICFFIALLIELIITIFATSFFLIVVNYHCCEQKQEDQTLMQSQIQQQELYELNSSFIWLIITIMTLNKQQQKHQQLVDSISRHLHKYQYHRVSIITNKLLNLSQISYILLMISQQLSNYRDQIEKLLMELSLIGYQQQKSGRQQYLSVNSSIREQLYNIAAPIINNSHVHQLVKLKKLPKVFNQLQLLLTTHLLNTLTKIIFPINGRSINTISIKLIQLHVIYSKQASLTDQFIAQLQRMVQLNVIPITINSNNNQQNQYQPQLFISLTNNNSSNSNNENIFKQRQQVRLMNQMMEFYHVFLYLAKCKTILFNSNNHESIIKFLSYIEESLSLKIFHFNSKLSTLTTTNKFKKPTLPKHYQQPMIPQPIANDDDDIIFYESQSYQQPINAYPSRYLTIAQNQLHQLNEQQQQEHQMIIYERFVKNEDTMETLDVIVEKLVQKQLLTNDDNIQSDVEYIALQRYDQLQQQSQHQQTYSSQQSSQQQQAQSPHHKQNIFSRTQFAFNFNLQQQISQVFTNNTSNSNQSHPSLQHEIKQYQ